jgi:hypothetical protein
MSRIYYLRNDKNIRLKPNGEFTKGNPIGVIVSEIDRETNTIRYELACVHKRDHFVKRRGFDIAYGRLLKQPFIIQGVPKTGHEITTRIMNDIFANDRGTYAARKLAREWLEKASKSREHIRVET